MAVLDHVAQSNNITIISKLTYEIQNKTILYIIYKEIRNILKYNNKPHLI